jgi:hypothetical protein
MPAGRPTAYRDEYAETAYRLALLGLTDAEVAEFFGVDPSTIYRWDEAHPEFCETRARGKLDADAKVAESLYKRAIGYDQEAVKIFMPAGRDEPVYAPYTERFPPDPMSASLWLRNRQSKRWKDKQEIAHEGKDGAPLFPALSLTLSKTGD